MNRYRDRLGFCGDDVYIDDSAKILRPELVRINDHSALDFCSYITTAAEIGKYVHIAPHVSIIGGNKGLLMIGDCSSLAAGCRVVCGGHKHLGGGLVGPTIPEEFQDDRDYDPVVLGRMVNVGTNAVILQGVFLSEGTVIGAGSLVTKSTEPWTIYAGTPARPIKERNRNKMLDDFSRLIGG